MSGYVCAICVQVKHGESASHLSARLVRVHHSQTVEPHQLDAVVVPQLHQVAVGIDLRVHHRLVPQPIARSLRPARHPSREPSLWAGHKDRPHPRGDEASAIGDECFGDCVRQELGRHVERLGEWHRRRARAHARQLQQLRRRRSLAWVDLEHSAKDLGELRGQVIGKRHMIGALDGGGRVEGVRERRHLVQYAAERPYVHLVVLRLAAQHLRRQVAQHRTVQRAQP
mmetsp:Transcript_39641/g.98174  ORF Transcript_39641/g.98174 Transcript_39641/m.98174 type:complete len:227 (+) Transcript_39641:80-760(+)